MSLLATDKEKEDHVRAAGGRWLEQQQTIDAVDLGTREKGKWKVISHDSPKKWVHDPTRPIRVNRTRESVYDRRSAATDDILERPLRNFFVIPEGCWRPWDLHPEATVRTGKCVVSMLHASLTKRNRKQVVEDGRVKKKSFYDHAMTEEYIEQELDQIFKDLKIGRAHV